ncbi:MAG TPA: alpha/beta fold hydrolase [Candidatus Acidoferrales bacterium]|nr:alpha/beta fold hydrolase [Candidatus Acidoferrales bacterium]
MAVPRYGRRAERGLTAAINRFLSELRNPTTPRAKVIAVNLAIIFFSFVTLTVVSGFFLSRAMNPLQADESIDPTRFLGNAQTVEFQTLDGVTHNGWFFPGLRAGPVVVLCHGFKSSRAEILTLATSLQQHRYNVLAFNFAGHGESPVGYTTLGGKEIQELRAALEMLSRRTDIDTTRIGLWGYSLGGYVVLHTAPNFPGVKAVVVDSVYPRPGALLRLELERLGGNIVPLVIPVAVAEFRAVSLLYGGTHDITADLNRTAGLPKLFIAGEDAPGLASMTQQLYAQAPGPKELTELPRTNMAAMVEEERRNYENVVVSFFFRSLPLVAESP